MWASWRPRLPTQTQSWSSVYRWGWRHSSQPSMAGNAQASVTPARLSTVRTAGPGNLQLTPAYLGSPTLHSSPGPSPVLPSPCHCSPGLAPSAWGCDGALVLHLPSPHRAPASSEMMLSCLLNFAFNRHEGPRALGHNPNARRAQLGCQ